MKFTDLMRTAVRVVVVANTIAWLTRLRTQDGVVVDPMWAWSLGLLAVLVGVAGTAPPEVRALVAVMGGVWGMRLARHLWMRMDGKLEDIRHAKFRAEWGRRAKPKLFFSADSLMFPKS